MNTIISNGEGRSPGERLAVIGRLPGGVNGVSESPATRVWSGGNGTGLKSETLVSVERLLDTSASGRMSFNITKPHLSREDNGEKPTPGSPSFYRIGIREVNRRRIRTTRFDVFSIGVFSPLLKRAICRIFGGMNLRHRSKDFEALRKSRLQVNKLWLRNLTQRRNSAAFKPIRITLRMAALMQGS